MYLLQRPLFFWVETPLHAGSGTDLGIVDLPIQREKHTDFPKIEASGVKGCLRDYIEQKLGKSNTHIEIAFGPGDGNDNHAASSLGFSDARLLLFPVKSVKDVFVWITCTQVITRFSDELKLCGFSPNFTIPSANTVSNLQSVCVKTSSDTEGTVVLEEYAFPVKETEPTKKFAEWLQINIAVNMETFWKNKIKTSLVVLSDEDFRDFATMSTEVIARTKIDDLLGTVARGALWYEEYLPTDSILYSLVFAGPVFRKTDAEKGDFQIKQGENIQGRNAPEKEARKVLNFFRENLDSIMQIGGNATVGKGLVRTVFLESEAKKEVAHA
ncbi:CRISPR-associated RAMP protein, Cmr4 family [Candidatus Moduliflexus flocculans]|uniref:CRISPR-associated RAMP protein, Cmr4 family n=1 Tax=Candidatus Moduliflexus flocculans TaxID=1499966 RepID=A0A081BLE2_9BACT|nr:CRISPR-associated RAMP protein, Cmr4 family [Candidatus Moduliflexus flocculans]